MILQASSDHETELESRGVDCVEMLKPDETEALKKLAGIKRPPALLCGPDGNRDLVLENEVAHRGVYSKKFHSLTF